jgi:hypothetical protein
MSDQGRLKKRGKSFNAYVHQLLHSLRHRFNNLLKLNAIALSILCKALFYIEDPLNNIWSCQCRNQLQYLEMSDYSNKTSRHVASVPVSCIDITQLLYYEQ